MTRRLSATRPGKLLSRAPRWAPSTSRGRCGPSGPGHQVAPADLTAWSALVERGPSDPSRSCVSRSWASTSSCPTRTCLCYRGAAPTAGWARRGPSVRRVDSERRHRDDVEERLSRVRGVCGAGWLRGPGSEGKVLAARHGPGAWRARACASASSAVIGAAPLPLGRDRRSGTRTPRSLDFYRCPVIDLMRGPRERVEEGWQHVPGPRRPPA